MYITTYNCGKQEDISKCINSFIKRRDDLYITKITVERHTKLNQLTDDIGEVIKYYLVTIESEDSITPCLEKVK